MEELDDAALHVATAESVVTTAVASGFAAREQLRRRRGAGTILLHGRRVLKLSWTLRQAELCRRRPSPLSPFPPLGSACSPSLHHVAQRPKSPCRRVGGGAAEAEAEDRRSTSVAGAAGAEAEDQEAEDQEAEAAAQRPSPVRRRLRLRTRRLRLLPPSPVPPGRQVHP